MRAVQTKRQIQCLLQQAGVRPRRKLGQNFLVDGNLMRRLVESAELTQSDFVLEVGAGTGGLTDLIAPVVHRCVCVEVDPRLCEILAERFRDTPSVKLLCIDALANKNIIAPEIAAAIGTVDSSGDRCIKLVANLPYQIATPLLMNLLVGFPQVRRFCFSVQAEVGDRLVSPPGNKAYGPLSVVSQCLARVDVIAHLPASVFWPRPTVQSVMMRMDVRPQPLVPHNAAPGFAAFVRGVFAHRRKALRAALRYVVDDTVRERVCASVDGMRRPESLNPQEWVEIFEVVGGGTPHHSSRADGPRVESRRPTSVTDKAP